MSDTQPQTAATGTLTVHYRSGVRDLFLGLPAKAYSDLGAHFANANDMEARPPFFFVAATFPDGRGIIINLAEVASIDFIPAREAAEGDEERWTRQNREAREEFAKVTTHLPRAGRAAS